MGSSIEEQGKNELKTGPFSLDRVFFVLMERKRVMYKDPDIDCINKQEFISENTHLLLTKEREIENAFREVPTNEKNDLQQSCIHDPSFAIDTSSSDSLESSSSNEWLTCVDDIEEADEENPQSPVTVSVVQNSKFILTDFIPSRKNGCSNEPPGNENNRCYQLSNTLLDQETNKSLKTGGDKNVYIKKTLRNEVRLSKNRIEPYFDEKMLTKNPQALLSSISKLYIGGYNKLPSLAGYLSESESSIYSEESTKKAIKSILKREKKHQIADNPKKKVRFDLNLRSVHDVSSDISQLPAGNNANGSGEHLDNKIKIELNRPHKYPENNFKEQIVESNIKIYREQCNNQNYFTNKESSSNTKKDDKMKKIPFTVYRECEKISFEPLAAEKLLEESPKLQESIKTKGIKNEVRDARSNPNTKKPLSDTMELIPSPSTVVQSNQLKTDIENGASLKVKNVGTDSGLENLCSISEDEYSLFIKNLVNGSGDKLARFLINLSSEISLKSGEEKIANALMSVGFVQEEKGSDDTSNETQRKTNNVKIAENKIESNKCDEDIGSLKKNHRNGLNADKQNERNLFKNNRRSMSEIDIHRLKAKDPNCRKFREKSIHSSRLEKSFIKETNDDCKCHQWSKNHPNTNGDVMGRLYEIMAELKQNVDKICRKESTIRIENAKIWLKENKQVEKSVSAEGSTKETYSQTDTIGVHEEGHIEKQPEGKTEILIISKSKNDEINIKLNDKSKENSFLLETNKTKYELNEIEERKRFLEENRHVPFDIVFNDKTHLPTLKKGKYEVEIFEKMDSRITHDTNFKNLMKKLTDNINNIKLNGLQNYDKPRNMEHSSSKSNYSRNSKQDKPEPNMLGTLLNKILKLKMNLAVKKTNRQFLNSRLWKGADQLNVLNSFNSDNKEDKNFNATNDRRTGSDNVGRISSKCNGCNKERTSICEDNTWPDVIKTRYPNGMIYFGPLSLMPEPNSEVCEKQSLELESSSCPKLPGSHQYVYNKHMKHTVKASMSKNLSQEPEGGISIETFSETEQEEFYHLWKEMGDI